MIKSRIVFPVLFFISGNISFAQNGIVKGKIRNSTELLASATVTLDNQTMVTDLKGEFSFSIKPGKYILTVTHAGYHETKKAITVLAGTVHDLDFVLQASNEMENVIVLGSRSLRQRSSLNTPVPIDVIQFSKLPERQVELTRIIENTIPSFNAAAHGFREGKQTVPVSLRGSGPDRTLVLLNGKRLHTIASPWTFGVAGFGTVGSDLNSIPFAAIETVEVMRDGASAQYGSDAIAGVINLQLKKSIGSTTVQLRTGEYYKGDGEAIALSLNRGFVFLGKGFLNLTAQTRFNNYTQRNGQYSGYVYKNCSGCSGADSIRIKAIDDSIIQARGFDRRNHRPLGDNRVSNTGFLINGGYPLNKKISFEWTGAFNYRVSNDISSNVYRYPKDSSLQGNINMQLYPDGFLPHIKLKMPDLSVSGGIDGITNSGWYWDASVIYGRNSSTIIVSNTNNATQYMLGKNAPTSFYTGKQIFSLLSNTIDFRKEFIKKTNTVKSLSVAFGAEFRIERYRILEGEEASWKNYSPASGRSAGSQGQSGFQPSDAVNKNRKVIGTYGEIEMAPGEKLLLNLATRYEYYSDFGSNLAAKLAMRYKFSKYILWRGSINNGFRAPALQQRYYNLLTTTSRNGVILRTGTFRNDSKEAAAFGISPLHAERSLNVSTGFTSKLFNRIAVTIDGYWIQIKNRIIYSATILNTYSAVRNILISNSLQDIQNVRFFSNAINTRTTGVDIVISGSLPVRKSFIEVSLAGNINRTDLYGSILYAKNLPDSQVYRDLLVNREEICRVTTAYPRTKMILNLSYKTGKWKMSAAFTRYGQIIQRGNDTLRNVNPKTYPDETFSSKIVSALNINYKVKPWLGITLGVENLFDVYPDKLKYQANNPTGLQPYGSNFAAFGINGGYYFIGLSMNLDRLN